MGDLENSNVKVTVAVKLSKFVKKNYFFYIFLARVTKLHMIILDVTLTDISQSHFRSRSKVNVKGQICFEN